MENSVENGENCSYTVENWVESVKNCVKPHPKFSTSLNIVEILNVVLPLPTEKSCQNSAIMPKAFRSNCIKSHKIQQVFLPRINPLRFPQHKNNRTKSEPCAVLYYLIVLNGIDLRRERCEFVRKRVFMLLVWLCFGNFGRLFHRACAAAVNIAVAV